MDNDGYSSVCFGGHANIGSQAIDKSEIVQAKQRTLELTGDMNISVSEGENQEKYQI